MESNRLNRMDIVLAVADFQRDYKVFNFDMVVGYGAAMVMHGLRKDTSDVDLDLMPDVFNRIVKEAGKVREHGLLGAVCDLSEVVSIHPTQIPDDGVVIIDGVPCHTLSILRFMKTLMAKHADRKPEKVAQDQADIAAIDELLAKRKRR